jgi:hypothetical protein
MSYLEIFGIASTALGVAFGFGKQSTLIGNLRKDTDAIAKMHRDTLQELSEIKSQLARIDQRMLFLEKH